MTFMNIITSQPMAPPPLRLLLMIMTLNMRMTKPCKSARQNLGRCSWEYRAEKHATSDLLPSPSWLFMTFNISVYIPATTDNAITTFYCRGVLVITINLYLFQKMTSMGFLWLLCLFGWMNQEVLSQEASCPPLPTCTGGSSDRHDLQNTVTYLQSYLRQVLAGVDSCILPKGI